MVEAGRAIALGSECGALRGEGACVRRSGACDPCINCALTGPGGLRVPRLKPGGTCGGGQVKVHSRPVT